MGSQQQKLFVNVHDLATYQVAYKRLTSLYGIISN
jgi:hypothetical protein